jgi:transglutaminase-like putative cysteine protease
VGLRQSIYLEPLSSRVLFAAARPLAFEIDPPSVPGAPRVDLAQSDEDEVFTGADRPSGFKYRAESRIEEPSPARLREVPDTPAPPEIERYLQLPAGLSPRIRSLAQEIVKGAHGPYARALAVRDHLQRLRYTTEGARDLVADPLDEFLFRRRAGHCEYFATAMAILLREVGLPTREVNGFYGGEWNRWGGYLALRQMDAHAWVEVWMGPEGWVTFDPTPPGGRAGALASSGLWRKLHEIEDSLELAWYKHMVEYSFDQQVSLARTVTRFGRRLTFGGSFPARLPSRGRVAWILVLAAAIGTLAFRRLTRRRAAGPRPLRPGQLPALRLYQRVLRRCARAGAVRASAETPGEFARALEVRRFPGASVVSEATALYYQVRFGGRTPLAEELAALAEKLDRIGRTP